MQRINPLGIRSLLFVPCVKRRFFEKILSLEGDDRPDGVIFDLEDSVHPDFKEQARENLREFFESEGNRRAVFDKYTVLIRVNSYQTEHFKEDIRLANEIRPHFLMLAK
ncbi:MAG TPA: aldolase/citrate lyase family protein, partial [archaeon]|nr:aldolase/citrate lyase family protein [archaeon]